jgi:hypothetical protein
MDEINKIRGRISKLQSQRSEELEILRRMTSCRRRKHSFGKFDIFKGSVLRKYETKIRVLRERIDELQRGTGDEYERDKGMEEDDDLSPEFTSCDPRRDRDDDEEDHENEGGDDEESSFSEVTDGQPIGDDDDDDSDDDDDDDYDDGANADGSDEDSEPEIVSVRNGERKRTIIEIESDSDDSSSFGKLDLDENQESADNNRTYDDDNYDDGGADDDERVAGIENDDVDGRDGATCGVVGGGEMPISGDGYFIPDRNFESEDGDEEVDNEEEDDDDGDIEEIERYHASNIERSRLSMAVQGFRCPPSAQNSSNDDGRVGRALDNATSWEPFDPDSVEHRGRTYRRNHCYVMETDAVTRIVGIKRFPSKDTAECILIERFEDTFIGTEDDGSDWVAPDYLKGTYVQVFKCIENRNLTELVREAENVRVIPKLIYERQTPGDWHRFGYFYDRVNIRQKGGSKRSGIRMLEVFAGAGGSLLGYKNEGFDSVMAIENDGDAGETLTKNNPDLNVYDKGCVRKFVDDYETLKCALGRIDHVSSMFLIPLRSLRCVAKRLWYLSS